MLLGVALASVLGVVFGVLGVSGRGMGVVGGFLVVAGLMMLGGFGVVFGSLRVVGGGVLVAFSCFLRHDVGIKARPVVGPRISIRSQADEVTFIFLHNFLIIKWKQH